MDRQTPPNATRRAFLANSVVASSAILAASNSWWGSHALAATDQKNAKSAVEITVTRQPLVRCRLELEVKGNVKVPTDPLQSQEAKTTLPVNSTASLDYEERLLMPAQIADHSEVVAAERYYHTATNSSVLNKTTVEQKLREEMRHVVVRRDVLPEVVYSPENYFNHDELSLLKLPISSVAVDRLLPSGKVLKDDRYEIDLAALCSVLNMTTIEKGKVECVVSEIDDEGVRFQIEGDVEGSVDGVSTRMRLLGKMTYDRSIKACTWLALALHETREISKAEPGFDILAKVRLLRRPLDQPVRLPAVAATVDFDSPPPEDRLFVELQSQHANAAVMMDRRWRMISDDPGRCVMRMIDHDSSIAQCDLRKLVNLPAGKHLTLEAFEADVRRSLGDQLVQLVEADQGLSAQDLRVMRIVADGQAQGVQVRWIMLHFSNDAGNRVQATFTMSGQQVDAFAGCDAQFGDTLRFLAPDSVPAESEPASESALTKNGQANPTVAEKETRSASDLK
ncbi:hypothetical protein [Rhodopirellula sp. MGV]|uniref:hypothetical protein n=1 Tax=Rhodopirellula sp. MGV TaxID=2023130 RepID=UPI000B978009|nr:hypothetical protein [Rhodopirellula sp. MGV]PNY33435.1 hypothetical protein C2E31_28470 [Rhodopirellula baltica]